PSAQCGCHSPGCGRRGTAATRGALSALFAPEASHLSVFSKTPFARLGLFDYRRAGGPRAALPTAAGKEAGAATAATDPLKEADRIVLSQYAPAGVVINDALDVVQFRGQTGPYLEASPGAASFHILKMAR